MDFVCPALRPVLIRAAFQGQTTLACASSAGLCRGPLPQAGLKEGAQAEVPNLGRNPKPLRLTLCRTVMPSGQADPSLS